LFNFVPKRRIGQIRRVRIRLLGLPTRPSLVKILSVEIFGNFMTLITSACRRIYLNSQRKLLWLLRDLSLFVDTAEAGRASFRKCLQGVRCNCFLDIVLALSHTNSERILCSCEVSGVGLTLQEIARVETLSRSGSSFFRRCIERSGNTTHKFALAPRTRVSRGDCSIERHYSDVVVRL
jgi:hypothetical protein